LETAANRAATVARAVRERERMKPALFRTNPACKNLPTAKRNWRMSALALEVVE
jgi:hypothetical protein